MQTLFVTKTADGAGTDVDWYSTGPGTLHIFGTWDGATVTISGSVDGTNFDDVNGGAFTKDTITAFEGGQIKVRATISSAGASTSLSAYLSAQGR